MVLSYFSPRGLSQAVENNIGTVCGADGSGGEIRKHLISGTTLWIAGQFVTYTDKNGKATACNGLAKIDLTTGLHDATFTTGTGFNSWVHDIRLYDGGTTLLCAGDFTAYNGTTRQRICKISASTGAINTTFNTASGANGTVFGIACTNGWTGGDDGFPHIAGNFTVYKGATRQNVLRLNGSTGALDAGYNSVSGANSAIYQITPYGYDSATATYYHFIMGEFTTYKGTTRQRIAKVNAGTAALITAFNSASGFDAYAFRATYGISGTDLTDLCVDGNFTTYGGTSRNRIAKLNISTGALDTTFAPGTGFNARADGLLYDGTNLYVSGAFTDYNGTARGGLVKISATTAALDTTFNPPNSGYNGGFSPYTIATDGSALYIGAIGTVSFYSGKPYGTVVKTSVVNAQAIDQELRYGFLGGVPLTGVISGGYAYLGGSFLGYVSPSGKYTAAVGIIKIRLINREADETFAAGIGTGLPGGNLRAMLLVGNDLYIAGAFGSFNGIAREQVAKLNATTGVLDTTFDSASGLNNYALCLAHDGSNGLYIGGVFTTYKGTSRLRLVKVDATTAALDTTFDTSTGPSADVDSLVFTGGALYVAGLFTTYKSVTRQYICKVNASTAALDTTFDSASGFNSTSYVLTTDGSGNILCGGPFTTYKGTARQCIAKLNPTTAALDTTFNTASGANGAVRWMIVDGSNIYVVGEMSTYKGTARQGIFKANASTGALDTTFNSASGFTGGTSRTWWVGLSNNVVYAIGQALAYKGNGRIGIAALDATSAIDGGIF